MSDKSHEPSTLPFTGERFLPEVSGQIAFEHLHRYHLAKGMVGGLRVLDVACGEGYGSHILAAVAADVVGVDIAADVVAFATTKYAAPGLQFVEATAAELPFENDSFDAVVSFETIEHHDLHAQMLSEIKRVLKPDGLVIISSPNKQFYTVESGYQNPYHVKELFREEFLALLGTYFSDIALFGQRVVHGSLIVLEVGQETAAFESAYLQGSTCGVLAGLHKPLYDIIVAADRALPELKNSLFESTVHGMQSASFYGVHLPERVANADAEIGELESRLAERAHPDRVSFDGLRARIEELAAGEQTVLRNRLDSSYVELESNRKAVMAAEIQLAALSGQLAIREAEIIQLQQVGAEKEARLMTAGRNLQERELALDDLRAHIDTLTIVHAQLEQARGESAATAVARHQELETESADLRRQAACLERTTNELLASHSWRLMKPLRWLRRSLRWS